MQWQYNIVCPRCGHTERRLDEEKTAWRARDGAPPQVFGEEVEYDEHIIDKDNNLVATGEVKDIVINCSECNFPD